MIKANSWNNKQDLGSQTLLTATKKLFFKEVESIFKSLNHSRKNESEPSNAYSKHRSNVKLTKQRGIFRNMVFETYLQLSLHIAIQQVNEYGATEIKALEEIIVIWRVLTSIDSNSVILARYPKMEKILRLLKSLDYMKTLTKEAVNDKTSNYLRWRGLTQI